jgi:hypothetical protein
MAWKGYAPLGKSKTIPTPDANKNGSTAGSMGNIHVEPVEVVDVKKDTNPVTGSRKARKQKNVTWS